MNKKNGNIEFMRFIFCLIIIFLHTGTRFLDDFNKTAPTFFRNGRISVEFFFIVSGYLMMHSLSKVNNNLPIHKNTFDFMLKKLLGIFPYHLFAFFITAVVYFSLRHTSPAADFVKLIQFMPNLFLIQRLGLPEKQLMAAEWYISAMLICMFIICPLALKFGKNFSRLFCPVSSVLLIGIIVHQTGMLGSPAKFMFGGIVNKGLVRAFAEICLGIFAFEVASKLRTFQLSKAEKISLTAAEFVLYAGSVFYTVSGFAFKYDSYALFAIAIAVTITFSGQSYFSGKINPKLASFLGKISFPLYLCQYVPFYFVETLMSEARFRYQFAVIVALSIICVPLNLYFGNKIRNKMLERIRQFNLI